MESSEYQAEQEQDITADFDRVLLRLRSVGEERQGDWARSDLLQVAEWLADEDISDAELSNRLRRLAHNTDLYDLEQPYCIPWKKY